MSMHALRVLPRPSPVWLILVWTAAFGLASVSAAPQQAQNPRNLVPVSDETGLISQGWAALAAGDAVTAIERANAVLGRNTQSVGALALLVEASIASRGATAGLSTYESWLGTRKLEEPYMIRRIALASLREAMTSKDSRVRLGALKALVREGDAEARAKVMDAIAQSQLPETRVMAELGDASSVQAIVKKMESTTVGSKRYYIEALASSGSRAAEPALAKMLDDPDPELKGAVIDALGKIGAKDMIERIRPFVQDGQSALVRWPAARALALMGDAAAVPFLQEMLHTELSDMLQIDAAEVLSSLGPNPDWINTARRLTGSADPQVRRKAAKIIAPYDQSLANEVLQALLLDPNAGIRGYAAETLASQVAADFLTLRRLLRHDDVYVQVLAAGRIAELTR